MFGAPIPGFDGDVDRRMSVDATADALNASRCKVTEEARHALELLDQLLKSSNEHGVIEHINTSKALLFQTFVKGGLGVGYQHAHGFVLFKTEDGAWSAPAFVSSKGLSLGLTLGYTKIETLVCMHTDKAVHRIKHSNDSFTSGVTMGVDFNVTMATKSRKSTGARSSVDFSNVDATGFAISKGMMADLSLKGAELHHDMDTNAVAYTSVPTLESILDGHVPPPRVFAPLYKKLDSVAPLRN